MVIKNRKLNAQDLRKTGQWTIPEIAKELCASKSSVSLWVKDIILTPEQLHFLMIKNHKPTQKSPKPIKIKTPAKNPYKYILRKDNKKIDVEHRFVMEQHIGRELSYNEVVHHIDGNRKNNDISNLEIQSRSKHSKYHIKPTNVIGVRCAYCGKITFKRRRYYQYYVRKGIINFYCNRTCSDKINKPPLNHSKKVYGGGLNLLDFVLQEYKKGKHAYQIAKEFNILKENVYYAFKKLNLPNKIPSNKKYPGLDLLTKKELDNGLNGYQISKKYNIPKATIYHNIKKINANIQ